MNKKYNVQIIVPLLYEKYDILLPYNITIGECILTLKESTDDKKLSSIEMTLENEIRINIDIIVKRQSDIMKLLRDNMVIENSKEMFSVRMNILETDVRNIKEKIGIA